MPRGAVALLATAVLLAGCAAPLVERAGAREVTLDGLPGSAGQASVVTDDGRTLRGVLVPPPAHDAPLVLHLMPRGASVTTGLPRLAGFPQTLAALADAGLGSLALDYRGVGASDGEPRAEALATDARAMWRAALERVGGDEGRVVVRATSLGSLALAALLAEGARPGAVVVAAPVRAATVVGHVARERHGAFLGGLGSLFVATPDLPDLVDVVPGLEAPLLVLLAEEDEYLAAEDVRALRSAARPTARFEVVAEGHHSLVARAYGFEMSALGGRLVGRLTEAESTFLAAWLARSRGGAQPASPRGR